MRWFGIKSVFITALLVSLFLGIVVGDVLELLSRLPLQLSDGLVVGRRRDEVDTKFRSNSFCLMYKIPGGGHDEISTFWSSSCTHRSDKDFKIRQSNRAQSPPVSRRCHFLRLWDVDNHVVSSLLLLLLPLLFLKTKIAKKKQSMLLLSFHLTVLFLRPV